MNNKHSLPYRQEAVATCRGEAEGGEAEEWAATGHWQDERTYMEYPCASTLGLIARVGREACRGIWRGILPKSVILAARTAQLDSDKTEA